MKNDVNFDLLEHVEQGGCSSKLSPLLLDQIVSKIPFLKHESLLVGQDTHDDAAIWKLNDKEALLQTTDFFPPLCSDPYEFGEIAAANALSDVFAMGGRPLTAMNIVMFPSTWDLKILEQILLGGAAKMIEAGAVLCGGHTIDDKTPKYGLAVSGLVDLNQLTTNADLKVGEVLILTKPIGSGVLLAGKKIGEVKEEDYQAALDGMKLLNKEGARLMNKYGVRAATDVTGFGLTGHALKMAKASGVTVRLNATSIPLLKGAYELAEMGCLPGALFRNHKYIEEQLFASPSVDYTLKMILSDAQTSGGLLMSIKNDKASDLLYELRESGYPESGVIGEVVARSQKSLLEIH